MSIWVYELRKRGYDGDSWKFQYDASWAKKCLFCKEPLNRIKEEAGQLEKDEIACDEYWFRTYTDVCPVCGWWLVRHDSLAITFTAEWTERLGAGDKDFTRSAAAGCLKNLCIETSDEPIEEVRSYLAAKYDARFSIHPRVFEETVASVFRDLGYRARVTGYSGDDGVDVILDGDDGELIGVQVKRYRGSIQVDKIRELTGALVIGGYTRGFFVTTSDFQSGADRTAELSALRGYPITLVNADSFYDALQIAQRDRYSLTSYDEAPFTFIKSDDLVVVDEDEFCAAHGGGCDFVITGEADRY